MPPTAINLKVVPPVQPSIPEGSIGYSPDNKRYKYSSGVWKLDVEVASVLPNQPK